MVYERSRISPAPLAGWVVLAGLIAAFAAVIAGRTALAARGAPRLFEIFDLLTVLASAATVIAGRRSLARGDWLAGLAVGALIAVLMPLSTLFNPYPLFDRVDDLRLHGLIRGAYTAVAMLGGLVVMHRGGPVRVRLARGEWRALLASLGFGAAVGIPFAVLNAFANSATQGRPFSLQSPLTAAVSALQPGVVEEAVYRLALLGLLWLVLRPYWGARAPWLAGILSMFVHAYIHYGDLFVSQPLMALVMGAVLGLIWGLPPTLLALRHDWEAAVGFHWMQDFARFVVGL